MALNFSHRPFSSHLSEEPMKIANGNWCSSFDKGDYGRKSTGDSSSSVDILDVLPSDPFGMDINNTFTAITGWLEDLDYNNQYGRGRKDDIWIGDGNHQQLFAGLSFIWNNAMQFQSSGYSYGSEFGEAFDGSLFSACKFPESSGGNNVFGGAFDGDGSCHGAFVSASSVDEVLSLENARNCEVVGSSDRCNNGEENANVHPAFGFSLYHLGVKDLLSVSMVCKSLHTTVCDDSLLWKHIHICQPLNEKITEESLLHLTERAQGTMQCLRLVDCCRITDDCLKRVLERNPQVVKLGVPGCTRITIDGILGILRDLKSTGKLQVKHLEIGGIFGVTKDHYDELFDLLNIVNNVEQTLQKPRFYHRGDSCVSCDDDRALDIEMCPKCQNSRLVYDCPAVLCLFWIGLVDDVGIQSKGTPLNLATLPVSVGLYGYCYSGHGVFPNIYTSMAKPSQFPAVLLTCFGICTLMYAGVAVMGYSMFGESTESQFTLNMPQNLVASKIALWTTVVNPFTKYALTLSPVAMSLEELIPSNNGKSRFYAIAIRSALAFSTLLVGLAIPFFGLVMSLIGSFLTMLITLILPPACFLSIVRRKVTPTQVTICISIMIVGAVCSAIGTYSALAKIIEKLNT